MSFGFFVVVVVAAVVDGSDDVGTMYNVQLAVKTQLIYCTICTMYTQLHVSAYFRPSSGCFI